jgi:hypothetical protein
MRNSFPSQISFVLPSIVCVAFYLDIPGSCSVKCTKTKFAAVVPSKETNEWLTHVVEQLTLGNHAERSCEKTGMLRCLEFLILSSSCGVVSSICAAPFSGTCWTQADCGCVAVALITQADSIILIRVSVSGRDQTYCAFLWELSCVKTRRVLSIKLYAKSRK